MAGPPVTINRRLRSMASMIWITRLLVVRVFIVRTKNEADCGFAAGLRVRIMWVLKQRGSQFLERHVRSKVAVSCRLEWRKAAKRMFLASTLA